MTDANTGNWPDPARPGVPMNPERDGWHWLVPSINHALPPGAYRWHAPPRPDVMGLWDAGHPLDVVRRGYDYLGPCLTPAEVAALVSTAAAAEREHVRDALNAALSRYPDSAPCIAWLLGASGCAADLPAYDDMQWAQQAAIRAGGAG